MEDFGSASECTQELAQATSLSTAGVECRQCVNEEEVESASGGSCCRGSGDCHPSVPCSKTMEPVSEEQGVSVRSTQGCSRRYSSQLSGRITHRRRAPQDMTKPLKMWMYQNKGNPYPTKKEKVALAMGSEMTLVQVSNWFANARRRLKNTVRQPGLSWSKRIKLYNKRTADNVEALSIASSVSDTELDANADIDIAGNSNLSPPHHVPPSAESCKTDPSRVSPSTAVHSQFQPPPPIHGPHHQPETANNLHKFKQSILHRYLNDSIQHQQYQCQAQQQLYAHHQRTNERTPPPASLTADSGGSIGSHDYEDVSFSPNSTDSGGNQLVFPDGCALNDELVSCCRGHVPASWTNPGRDIVYQTKEAEDTYWKEITAALVLTNMARAKRQQRLL